MRAVRPDAGHHHAYRAATARGARPLEGDPARPPAITRAIAAGHPLPVAVIDTYALARFFSARARCGTGPGTIGALPEPCGGRAPRSEEHTSELQSRGHLVCRLLLEKQ